MTAPDRPGDIRPYLFPAEADVRADLRDRYGYEGDLLDIYAGNKGPVVHKWHHVLPIYERHLSAWRGKPVRFLEIGVGKGGSLQMWRRWFGPKATLFAIDINPDCARHDGVAGAVRIGSQADADFLGAVVDEMGGVDVVLDDGSHVMEHIEASLDALFPRVSDGGTYMIEDLHTAYWPKYGGGPANPANFFNTVRRLTDDMHAWYHRHGRTRPAISEHLSGLHVYDSVVVLDKRAVQRPTHSKVGGGRGAAATTHASQGGSGASAGSRSGVTR